jgi:tetratricopeptide (TPR) repeat protein
MGVVYRVYRADLKQEYALKCILQGPSGSSAVTGFSPDEAVERFQREARAVAKLGKHDHIVQVHDVGTAADINYLVMELVRGRPLDAMVHEEPLAPDRAAEIARDVAEGLTHAHAQGLLHRDLKPGNVLVESKTGRALITDFGLARDVRTEAALTVEGSLLGTPEYMAPEQAHGAENTTEQSDVYALGGTLYQMLTGLPPHSGASAMEVLASLATREPDHVTKHYPDCPRDLAAITHKALAKEFGERYASAEAMAEDLDRFLRGVPTVARPAGPAERVVKWVKRHPALAGAALAVVAALGAAGWAVAEWQGESASRAKAEAERETARKREKAAERERAAAEREREEREAAAEKERQRQEAIAKPWRTASEIGLGPDGRTARMKLLNESLALDPKFLPALIERGRTHAAGGRLQDAQEDFDRVLELDAENVDGLWARARFHRNRTGDLQAAYADFTRLHELAPDSPRGLVALAWAKTRERDYSASREALAAARAAQAPAAECFFVEGICAMSSRPARPGEAERLFLRATQEDPLLLPAYHRRSNALEDMGRKPEAIAEIQRAIKAAPEDYNSYYYRGRFFSQARQYEQAYRDYTRVLDGRPRHAQARINRANCLKRLGQLEQALAELAIAEEHAPHRPEIPGARADVLNALKRYDEALKWYGVAIERRPDRLTPYFNRASLLMNVGRPADAIPDFEFVLRRETRNHRGWYYLGWAYERVERYADAIRAIENAIGIHPGDRRYQKRLAALYEREKRHAEAAATYRSWAKANPTDAEAWLGRARALDAQGKTDLAKGVLLQGLAACEGTPGEAPIQAELDKR